MAGLFLSEAGWGEPGFLKLQNRDPHQSVTTTLVAQIQEIHLHATRAPCRVGRMTNSQPVIRILEMISKNTLGLKKKKKDTNSDFQKVSREKFAVTSTAQDTRRCLTTTDDTIA